MESMKTEICFCWVIFLTLNDGFLKMVQFEGVNDVFIFITHQLPILELYEQKFNLHNSFSHRPPTLIFIKFCWVRYIWNMGEQTGPPGVCDVMCHKWKTYIIWAGALYILWKQWVCARLVVKWFEWYHDMLLYQTNTLV